MQEFGLTTRSNKKLFPPFNFTWIYCGLPILIIWIFSIPIGIAAVSCEDIIDTFCCIFQGQSRRLVHLTSQCWKMMLGLLCGLGLNSWVIHTAQYVQPLIFGNFYDCHTSVSGHLWASHILFCWRMWFESSCCHWMTFMGCLEGFILDLSLVHPYIAPLAYWSLLLVAKLSDAILHCFKKKGSLVVS